MCAKADMTVARSMLSLVSDAARFRAALRSAGHEPAAECDAYEAAPFPWHPSGRRPSALGEVARVAPRGTLSHMACRSLLCVVRAHPSHLPPLVLNSGAPSAHVPLRAARQGARAHWPRARRHPAPVLLRRCGRLRGAAPGAAGAVREWTAPGLVRVRKGALARWRVYLFIAGRLWRATCVDIVYMLTGPLCIDLCIVFFFFLYKRETEE